MYSDKKDKYKELVKSIGYVDQLSTEKLIEISRELFELVSFCDCEVDNLRDEIVHGCTRFNNHDHEHSPTCKCCQQRMLTYYLGWCMDKLTDNGRLPQFDRAQFTIAKIRDRTYEHIKIGSELIFSIIRHLNAWRDEFNTKMIVQNWVFDFENLSLRELPYNSSRLGVAVSVRRLMELKSEWKGTATEFLAKLNEVAGTLKIDTKGDQWPKSPRKLNQELRLLKGYLQKYGTTVEKKRYVKLSKYRS